MNRKDSRQNSIVQRPPNRKGFTLIEIIVVLGIITGGLGVIFIYIDQTQKSKDMFSYQSALRDLALAVDTYKQAFGSASLTQDSLVASGFLPATWTPMETVEVLSYSRTWMKTANEEFLFNLAVSRTHHNARYLYLMPYKHPIRSRTGEPDLLNAYCENLKAEMFPITARCWKNWIIFTDSEGRTTDRLYAQVLGFWIEDL